MAMQPDWATRKPLRDRLWQGLQVVASIGQIDTSAVPDGRIYASGEFPPDHPDHAFWAQQAAGGLAGRKDLSAEVSHEGEVIVRLLADANEDQDFQRWQRLHSAREQLNYPWHKVKQLEGGSLLVDVYIPRQDPDYAYWAAVARGEQPGETGRLKPPEPHFTAPPTPQQMGTPRR